MTEVKGMSEESLERRILISAKIFENNEMSETVYLLKDGDIGEYYLERVTSGWKQISETEKTWGTLIEYKYYISKPVVPLIYYVLVTNPKQFNYFFEFLYQNGFLSDEE